MSYRTPWGPTALDAGAYRLTINDAVVVVGNQRYTLADPNPQDVAVAAGQATSVFAHYNVETLAFPTPYTTSLEAGKTYMIAVPAIVDTYRFARWEDNSTNPSRTVTMTADKVITAYYELDTYYTLTVGQNITLNPAGGSYLAGTTVYATAAAPSGYAFTNWLLDGINAGSTNPLPINMNTNHTLDAVFTPLVVTITLNVAAGVGGTVYPSGQLPLTVGQAYQFTETEGIGYNFDHWDLAGASKGSTQSIILTITSDMDGQTLTALFATEPPPTVTVTIAVAGNGSTDIAPGQQTFNIGDVVRITAIPRAGATFLGWKLDGVDYSVANPLDLTVTTDLNGKTLTADFTTPTLEGFPWWIIIGVASAGALIGGYAILKK